MVDIKWYGTIVQKGYKSLISKKEEEIFPFHESVPVLPKN